jgi:hypothetical protein
MTIEQQILAELKATRMEIDNLKLIVKSMTAEQAVKKDDGIAQYKALIKKYHQNKIRHGSTN